MKLFKRVFLALLIFTLVPSAVGAVASVKPQDSAEKTEAINTYNSIQEEKARSSFRSRILGIEDEAERNPDAVKEAAATRKAERDAVAKQRQAENEQKKSEIEANRVEKMEQRDEAVGNRCEQAEARINNRINTYESNKDKHVGRYNGIKMRLTNLISMLQDKDCDTTNLEESVAELDTMIQALTAAHLDFINSLKGSKEFACGESQGQFASSVQEARGKLALVKQHAEAIHRFVSTTLKPEFQAAAEACRAGQSNNEES